MPDEPRHTVSPPTKSAFAKDTEDRAAHAAEAAAQSAAASTSASRESAVPTYQQKGNALGALGNAIEAIKQSKADTSNSSDVASNAGPGSQNTDAWNKYAMAGLAMLVGLLVRGA